MQVGAGRGPAAVSAAAAAAALGVVGGLAFDAGGYFPAAYLEGGAVALAALGVLLSALAIIYLIVTRILGLELKLDPRAFWQQAAAAYSG